MEMEMENVALAMIASLLWWVARRQDGATGAWP